MIVQHEAQPRRVANDHGEDRALYSEGQAHLPICRLHDAFTFSSVRNYEQQSSSSHMRDLADDGTHHQLCSRQNRTS
ncbi:hypothetical protein L484_008134 [Morus notabilis]|uniref:Uncharacterized protein n=1 Tax=Morus notabilis TaxID=981085 RepID=W9RVN2_9ROSA|nr:hypothetical protein L484_008134 [Morus notabilis]